MRHCATLELQQLKPYLFRAVRNRALNEQSSMDVRERYQASVQADTISNIGGAAVPSREDEILTIAAIQAAVEQLPELRRLAQQYGPCGVSITLVTKTQGYWLRDGQFTGPVTSAQEAAADSSYYLGYLRLPITVAIQTATYNHDAERRLQQSAPVQFEASYGKDVVVLVDGTGHILVIDRCDLLVPDETRLKAYIDRALNP